MKQKYLREHIPQFDSDDNEELVECLLVVGINSFLDSCGQISRNSMKPLRTIVGNLFINQNKFAWTLKNIN